MRIMNSDCVIAGIFSTRHHGEIFKKLVTAEHFSGDSLFGWFTFQAVETDLNNGPMEHVHSSPFVISKVEKRINDYECMCQKMPCKLNWCKCSAHQKYRIKNRTEGTLYPQSNEILSHPVYKRRKNHPVSWRLKILLKNYSENQKSCATTVPDWVDYRWEMTTSWGFPRVFLLHHIFRRNDRRAFHRRHGTCLRGGFLRDQICEI